MKVMFSGGFRIIDVELSGSVSSYFVTLTAERLYSRLY
jgi:hypothetical protein